MEDGGYHYWEAVLETELRVFKVWKHVDGTAIRPSPSREIKAAVRVVATVLGADAVEALTTVIQHMVDEDMKKLEDYDAGAARANNIIFRGLSQRDVMVVRSFPTPKAKWNKLAADYAPKSVAMAAGARSRFTNYRVKAGETVVQNQHVFEGLVTLKNSHFEGV